MAFEKDQAFKLSGFLDSEVLSWFQKELEAAQLVAAGVPEFYTELGLPPCHRLRSYLSFLMNDFKLFQELEHITNLGPFTIFTGRVFRRMGIKAHHDEWHDDVTQGRALGVSINLGNEYFDGGEFFLRRKESKELLFRAHNTEPGDAVFFRISPELEHMVTPVASGSTRTVLAGWFRVAHQFTEEMFQEPDFKNVSTGKAMPRRFVLRPSVLLKDDRVGFRVYSGEMNCSLQLNDTGKAILEALLDGGSIEEAQVALLKKYRVSPEVLLQEIRRLTEALAERGLFLDEC